MHNYWIIWYAFVFISIMGTFFLAGIDVVFGEEAWTNILDNSITFWINIFCIFVMVIDMGIQYTTGYVFRGGVIIDKKKVR